MTDSCAWLAAHGSSCVELLGFVSGALCVYLVTRESIWNWPLGMLTSALYIVVFGRAGLYSDTALQVVYLLLSGYGWWHWRRGGDTGSNDAGTGTPTGAGDASATYAGTVVVSRVPRREFALLVTAGVALWLLLYTITSRIPGARLPLLDAALTSTSLVAQYMMTRKYVEHWILWIIVDVVYVGLFFSRDLRLTSVLYAVYLALAIFGYLQWKRSAAKALHASS